jgi:hypothetical protein
MLQVARLAPIELGESRELVVQFLRDRLNPDGAFQDRAGLSDLYYTVFGLDGLLALQAELPAQTVTYLTRFGDGAELDFVHLACLARSWSALRPRLNDVPGDAILRRLEEFRSADGGYAPVRGAEHGTVYAAFLALGAYEDLHHPMPDSGGILHSIERLQGGFFAAIGTPVPDLLSTATALHALTALQMPTAGLREPCLDFVDSLWTNRGGFHSTWLDDALDCEYTYYGLLALGHLSLRPS